MRDTGKSFLRFSLMLLIVLSSQLYCDQADVYNNALKKIIAIFTPTPGDSGLITASNIGATSLTLHWTKATDNKTPQEDLEYIVYKSDADDIGTVLDAEKNGTSLCEWTVDIDTIDVTLLSVKTSYYFNVIVKDERENKSAYTMAEFGTISDDGLAPEPGNGGSITLNNILTNSITLSWTKATDDKTDQANLQYRAFYSTSENIYSVIDAEANGTSINDWTNDIDSIAANGLMQYTHYYFNVLVLDDAGNKSAYSYSSVSGTTGIEAYYVCTPGNGGDDVSGDGSSGKPYETIQKAMDTADTNGVGIVWVQAGDYNESITLNDGVSIYGGYCGDFTICDPNSYTTTIRSSTSNGKVVDANNISGSTTVIDGFTITNENNTNSDTYGIYVSASTKLVIQNNDLYGGDGTMYSYGILIENSSSPDIRNNTIDGGSGGSGSSGIYNVDNSSSCIYNNVIDGGNGDSSFGIVADNGSDIIIRNNTINGGSGATDSRSVSCNNSSNPVIQNNIIFTTGGGSKYGFYQYDSPLCNPLAFNNNNIFNCTHNFIEVGSIAANKDGLDGNVSVDLITKGYFVDFNNFENDGWQLVDIIDDDQTGKPDEYNVAHGGLDGSALGWGFNYDKLGNSRSGDTVIGWSMGAYELD